MGHSPRILVCEHDENLRTQVAYKLQSAGFWVDTAHTARTALQLLERHNYAAMTLSLVLSDQDSVSFLNDLDVLGFDLPILVTSIRNDRPVLSPRLMNNLDIDIELDSSEPEPEWVRKAADQARIIFAIKSACQRSRQYHPRILHIEPDGFSAGLITAALQKSCEVTHVCDLEGLHDVLCQGPYDIVLLNPAMDDDQSQAAMQQIAWAYPGIPIVLHSQYALTASHTDIYPIHADTGQIGLGLIEALRQRILYSMDTPNRAHA